MYRFISTNLFLFPFVHFLNRLLPYSSITLYLPPSDCLCLLQVTSLSAELTAVGTKLDSMTKTTIQISKNLMEATSTNTENLAKLGEKLDYLALIQGTQKAAELAESEEQKKTEQRNKMLYFAIRKLSHNNKATIAALSQMSHRVNDLERYASPMDGALVNASAMIGKNFEQIYSRLEMMAENQATFISVVKRAMTTVTRKINNNTERLDQKQKQFVSKLAQDCQ